MTAAPFTVDALYHAMATETLHQLRGSFEADRRDASDPTSIAFIDDRLARIDRVLAGRGVPSITCPHCRRTSYNAHDIRERYCGFCHRFLEAAP
jgi:hypothetical protein